jgi:hypothetical protein
MWVARREGYVTLGLPLRNTTKLPAEMSFPAKFPVGIVLGSFLRELSWEVSCRNCPRKFPAGIVLGSFFVGIVLYGEVSWCGICLGSFLSGELWGSFLVGFVGKFPGKY